MSFVEFTQFVNLPQRFLTPYIHSSQSSVDEQFYLCSNISLILKKNLLYFDVFEMDTFWSLCWRCVDQLFHLIGLQFWSSTAKVGLKDNPIILSIMYFNSQFDRKSPKNANIQTRGGGSFYCRNGPKFRLRLKKYINFDFKFGDFAKILLVDKGTSNTHLDFQDFGVRCFHIID